MIPRIFFIVLMFLGGPLFSQTETASREYALKAVFLYQCSRFVEWPPSTFQSPSDPIIIGVVGSDPFGTMLEDTVRGEVINNRKIVVRRFASASEIKDCQILFIGDTDKADEIIAEARIKNILTVADSSHFANRGGIIQLDIEKNKLQVKINLKAAKATGLSISSKLLRLSQIVDSET